MKKIVMMVMMFVMVMNLTVTSYAARLGEYENQRILDGTYEVCEKYPRVKGLGMTEWTKKDLFGNSYRIYSYVDNGEEKLVCLKRHEKVKIIKTKQTVTVGNTVVYENEK